MVAVLTALSAPSFQPIQLSVLYGYRSEVVVAAVRWGWILAPLGLVAAALVRYLLDPGAVKRSRVGASRGRPDALGIVVARIDVVA